MKSIEEVKNTLSSLSWMAFEEDRNKLIQLFNETNNEGKIYILEKMESDNSDTTKLFLLTVAEDMKLNSSVRSKALITLSKYKDRLFAKKYLMKFLDDDSTEIVEAQLYLWRD